MPCFPQILGTPTTPTAQVFLDVDGDRVFSAADRPAAGARVFYEDSVCVTTDSEGFYSLPNNIRMPKFRTTRGGYRVFRESQDGELEVIHRSIVNEDIAVITSPVPWQVSEPCKARILASVEMAAVTRQSTWLRSTREAATDCGSIELASRFPTSLQASGDKLLFLSQDGALHCVDAASGDAYFSTATPTVGDGQLFIGTQRGTLLALDINTGITQWVHHGDDSLIRVTHYHGRMPAFSAAPTSTPGRVWLPSTDGTVRVLDSSTGLELWRTSTGVPTTSSAVLAGDCLYIATFDGTIRAMSARP